jgi:LacI family transcriptional regulator
VARLARVSPITVSRVVNKHPNVSRGTRERVLRAIAELNYIPNAAARGLKQARSDLLALIITDINSPFYTAAARGAEDAARAAGLSLILGNSDEDPAVEAEYLRVMGERRVDGVILSPTDQAGEAIARNLPVGLPIVLFDRAAPGVEADLVTCDTQTGARVLCRHLLHIGHRRIAIVGGLPSVATWPARVAGYEAALREAGQPLTPELVIAGDYKSPGGVAAVRHLLARDDLPDAIIAANAQVAIGVLEELAARGIRVPEDVGVAAIDDPLPNLSFLLRFTVVEQPGYQMGKAAVEILVARLRGTRTDAQPWRLVFDAQLRPGQSCGEGRVAGADGTLHAQDSSEEQHVEGAATR